jgi:hypothetical protein
MVVTTDLANLAALAYRAWQFAGTWYKFRSNAVKCKEKLEPFGKLGLVSSRPNCVAHWPDPGLK